MCVRVCVCVYVCVCVQAGVKVDAVYSGRVAVYMQECDARENKTLRDAKHNRPAYL